MGETKSRRKKIENEVKQGIKTTGVQQASPLPQEDTKNDGGGEPSAKKDAIHKPKEEQKKSNELVQPQVATAMLKVHSNGERNIGGEGGLDGEKTEKSYGDEFGKHVDGDTKKPTVDQKKQEAKAEKPEVTKSNEPGMTTTVVEMHFCGNCEGLTHQIQKVVLNTTGNYDMTIDAEKGLVTVRGGSTAESLRQQLNKDVQILATEANEDPQ